MLKPLEAVSSDRAIRRVLQSYPFPAMGATLHYLNTNTTPILGIRHTTQGSPYCPFNQETFPGTATGHQATLSAFYPSIYITLHSRYRPKPLSKKRAIQHHRQPTHKYHSPHPLILINLTSYRTFTSVLLSTSSMHPAMSSTSA